MKTEKQNNFIKKSVTGLQKLPTGFTFNSAAVWQQLENELQPKHKRKGFVFFMAAAVLLLIAASVFLLFQPKNNIKQQQLQVNNLSTANSNEPNIKSNKTVKIFNTINTNKTIETTKKHVIDKPDIKIKKTDSIIGVDENKATVFQLQEPNISTNITIPINNILKNNNIVQKQQVQRFKIMHLNEIDNATAKQPTLLTKTEIKQLIEFQQNIQLEKEIQPQQTENVKQILFFKIKTTNGNTLTDNQ